jgi:hypothetical protein
MRDRNNCNPQLEQRRLPIGGNGDGSGRFGCGMVQSDCQGRKSNCLSATDFCRQSLCRSHWHLTSD